MSEPNQSGHREAADEDFLKSLNELEDMLQENLLTSEQEVIPTEAKTEPIPEPELKIDLAAWEDAVADIEKFLESK